LTGCVFPLIAGVYAAAYYRVNIAAVVIGLPVLWCAFELMLARAAGWHLSRRLPLAFMVRDLLLPVLWFDAWLNDDVVWRGTRLAEPREEWREAAGD